MKKHLFCVLLAMSFLLCVSSCNKKESTRSSRFADSERLSSVLGVELPEYTLLSDTLVWENWMGDCECRMVIEFNRPLTQSFYASLDSVSAVDSMFWSKTVDGSYWFSRAWGNAYPAPPGEDPEMDLFVQLKIPLEARTLEVVYGAW